MGPIQVQSARLDTSLRKTFILVTRTRPLCQPQEHVLFPQVPAREQTTDLQPRHAVIT